MYKVVWHNENYADFAPNREYYTFEEAEKEAKNLLCCWMSEEKKKWAVNETTHLPEPTEEQIDDWNEMIENCYIYIVKTEGIDLSDEDYKEIGWMKWNENIEK